MRRSILIGLYNLEPKYINIALEKIRLYHTRRGDTVQDYHPIEHDRYDMIYCSSIFTWTNKSYVTNDMACGGTGFDLTTTLPSEIEAMKPKINIGFTTRGCIRRCPFCVVPEKEGALRVVNNIDDIWDRKSDSIILLDNNILALPKHFHRVCEDLQTYGLRVDFNQGLDFRLLSDKIIALLKLIRHCEYRFSFDHIRDEGAVIRAINLLQGCGVRKSMWFVLVGFNTTYQEDLYRLQLLKEHGQDAYVQRYNHITNAFYITLAQWANQHALFRTHTFEEYARKRGKERVIINNP